MGHINLNIWLQNQGLQNLQSLMKYNTDTKFEAEIKEQKKN